MDLFKTDTAKHDINFYLPDGNSKSVKKVDRDDLMAIMQQLYDDSDFYQFPDDSTIDTVNNDMISAITKQISKALRDFQGNVKYVKEDVESAFPEIDE